MSISLRVASFFLLLVGPAQLSIGEEEFAPSNSPDGVHLGGRLLYIACHPVAEEALELTKSQVEDLQTLNTISAQSDKKDQKERLAVLRDSYKDKSYKAYKTEEKRVIAELKFTGGEWKIERLKETLDKRQFRKLCELAIREIGISSLRFLKLQTHLGISEAQARKIEGKSKELIAKSKERSLKNADEFHKLVAEKYGEDFEMFDVQEFGEDNPDIEEKLLSGPRKKWTTEYIEVMESMLTPTQLATYRKLMEARSLRERTRRRVRH